MTTAVNHDYGSIVVLWTEDLASGRKNIDKCGELKS